MLTVAAYAAQALLIALIAYNTITALWGWPHAVAAPPGPRRRRLRVVVPAHDEEAVIGGLLADLAAQDYPTAQVSVVVVADRCEDGTALVAAPLAAVAERREGQPGKGPALAWYLDRQPLEPDEALIVFDADNRVPPELLGLLADELDAGRQALQAYLGVANPDGSPLAAAAAVSYWASNRMVQLARRRLGWPADLGGTGMCITAEALAAAGGFGASLTEDQELGARLALAGHPVAWVHHARLRDEKPEAVGVVVRQRARWAAGRRQVARRFAGPLLGQAVKRRSWGLADLAVRLVQPGRSFVALLSALLAALAAATGTGLLFPWGVWAAVAAMQFLLPVAFLAREGVAPRYLVRYPLLVLLAALWLPIRLLSRVVGRRWYHTPHGPA